MYDVPTTGCNLEIMGHPFFIDSVTPNEAFRRRNYNFNNIIGGTQKVTKGEYVGLDFTVTTFVKIDPQRPDMHNNVFKKMMAQPVTVSSPDLGGVFKAVVTIKPERHSPRYLKLSIGIKEVPDRESHIPGESFKVPKAHAVTVKKNSGKNCKNVKFKNPFTGKNETINLCAVISVGDTSKKKSKKKSSAKKSKSKKSRK